MILSAAIVVIVALIMTVTLEMFSSNIKSMGNSAASKSTFYLAQSALQIAKRDIIANGKGCLGINNQNYTSPNSIPNIQGQYTVNSCHPKVEASLLIGTSPTSTFIYINNSQDNTGYINSNISETTNSIQLSNASSFDQTGSIKINDEYISYNKKNGNTLSEITRGVAGTAATSHNSGTLAIQGFFRPTSNTEGIIQINDEIISYKNIVDFYSIKILYNITRGIAGTTAESHYAGDEVKQNQCILTADSAIPDFLNSENRKTIQENIIVEKTSSLLFGENNPPVISSSNVTLSGSGKVEVFNSNINSGSTIISSGNIRLRGGAQTRYNDTLASTPYNISTDIELNATYIEPLFINIFSNPDINSIKNMPQSRTVTPNNFKSNNFSYTRDEIIIVDGTLKYGGIDSDSKSPYVLIVDGDFKLNGSAHDINIGTESEPTIIIVTGNYNNSGDAKSTINGLLYTMGNFSIGGSAATTVKGFSITEGRVKVNGAGRLILHPNFIQNLSSNPLLKKSNSSKFINKKEIFE